MDLRFVTPDLRRLDDTSAEVIACSMWQDERPMRGLLGLLDWRLAGKISKLARESFMEGERGTLLCVPGRPRLPFDKILVMGLGHRKTFDAAAFRGAVTQLLRSLEGLHVRRAVVELPGRADNVIEAERAAEIVLEQASDSPAHDAWWLVEAEDAHARIAQRAQDERRRTRQA